MQLYEEVAGPGGRNLGRLSADLDLTEQETASVVRAVLPEISLQLQRNTLSRDGLATVIDHVGNPAQQKYLEPETDLTAEHAIGDGNALLGDILHTKYQSRALADRAAAETGVSAAKIRRLLPRVANLAMGALSHQTRPGLEEIFKRLPGYTKAQAPPPTTPNVAQNPLPVPGDDWGGARGQPRPRSGYDDLSDVLTRRQRPFQSNPLWDTVRQVIGSALGFQGKGIIGYIIRFLVVRYGWRILSSIFRRFLKF